MQLHQAYEIMRQSAGKPTSPDLLAAQNMVYEELQRRAQKKNWSSYYEYRHDCVHECFINLINRGTPLKELSDSSARGLIDRSLHHVFLDLIRKLKSDKTVAIEDILKNKDKENSSKKDKLEKDETPPSPEDILLFHERAQNSVILAERPDERPSLAYLHDYLEEVVSPQVSKRQNVQASTKEAIKEMRALVAEEMSFEALILENLGEDADLKAQKKERNRIHKNHERSRTRLLDWVERQAQLAVGSSPDAQLNDLDCKLLRHAIEALRSRAASSG